ncbi:hypothetical protein Y032_0673g1398 [Ancylostoma ceylanicum]|nr:hypothetical protein Y032_0673g1398 [Ancylostoma ceylanicum]
MIAGLYGVAAYLDDIIVTGRNIKEHRHSLEGLFKRIYTYGFRVRMEKCTSEIRYLGDIIDKSGRCPDPEKIRAITEMPVPKEDAVKKYGQIEKEGLALVYAVLKFHRYLLGGHFALLTVHTPLLAIYGSRKGLSTYGANRLLRWSLILRGYDFTIEYRKTANFGQVDALSRLIAEQTTPSEDVAIAQVVQEAEANCRVITGTLPVDIKMIAGKSAKDDTLKNVISYVQKDKWPNEPSVDVARYFALRQSLAIQDDCLFFGPRLVIPSKLRRRVLQLSHDGHPGTTRMQMLARSYVHCTNITKDLEDYVRGCRNCQEVAKAPLKAELSS